MIKLHDSFINNLESVIGGENIASFLEALELEPKSSIRKNPFKDIGDTIKGTPIEWCKEALRLDERFSFTLDPLFHSGCYYVQESSSMFIEPLLKYAIGDRKSGLRVLDLCAAPGGKTTHIASLIGAENMLVSNEVIVSRSNVLKENVIKWGCGNIVVTNSDPHAFSSLTSFFDIVVVDAPCSGEGMFRKNEKARSEWSPKNVELCHQRQQRILADAWEALAPNGFLIYSTCTFNRRENEEQVEWLEQEMGGTMVNLDIPLFHKVIKSDKGFRFHPDKVEGEGFFVSMVQKGDCVLRKEKKRITKKLPKAMTIEKLSDKNVIFTTFNGLTYIINSSLEED
ncbi:MAG: rRNA cytosine-C5-methyltransferase, partial [Rikenellaceae bacterium]